MAAFASNSIIPVYSLTANITAAVAVELNSSVFTVNSVQANVVATNTESLGAELQTYQGPEKTRVIWS